MNLEDGVSHAVDSSELAFRLASRGAMRTYFPQVYIDNMKMNFDKQLKTTLLACKCVVKTSEY